MEQVQVELDGLRHRRYSKKYPGQVDNNKSDNHAERYKQVRNTTRSTAAEGKSTFYRDEKSVRCTPYQISQGKAMPQTHTDHCRKIGYSLNCKSVSVFCPLEEKSANRIEPIITKPR